MSSALVHESSSSETVSTSRVSPSARNSSFTSGFRASPSRAARARSEPHAAAQLLEMALGRGRLHRVASAPSIRCIGRRRAGRLRLRGPPRPGHSRAHRTGSRPPSRTRPARARWRFRAATGTSASSWTPPLYGSRSVRWSRPTLQSSTTRPDVCSTVAEHLPPIELVVRGGGACRPRALPAVEPTCCPAVAAASPSRASARPISTSDPSAEPGRSSAASARSRSTVVLRRAGRPVDICPRTAGLTAAGGADQVLPVRAGDRHRAGDRSSYRGAPPSPRSPRR